MRRGTGPGHNGGLRGVGGGVALALLPSLSLAAAAPSPATTVSELTVTASKTVEELTVTAPKKCLKPLGNEWWTRGPKIVSTFPAKGAVVRPGVVVLRVTFDAPMACAGVFSNDPPFHNPCPGRLQHMLLSYDRLTVRTACVVEPNADYGAWISRDGEEQEFVSLRGAVSSQFELRFSTSAEAPVTTVCEALSQDEETAREIRKRRKLDCGQP